ncbi:MAG: pyridoxal-phosphate dependent enzyme [Candidatus Riflebacteria bacterium]|nr:pyridoxal-phosphate dependent enzyme [Candidatus Riflebacteria bacterium]
MELLKQRIGRTVLYKTANLNQDIGIAELYLKMEGLNPTGHMHDRIAYYLVKEAVQLGFKTVVVASLGQLGESLAFVSERFGLSCRVVMPQGSMDKKKRWYQQKNVEIIEHGSNYSEAYRKSRELADSNNWYDANHGYDNCCITDNVFAEIAEEIVAKLGASPKSLFCFLSNGALITGLHLGFRSLWRRGLVQRIPRLFVACASDDNPLYLAWKNRETRVKVTRALNRYRGLSKNTVEYNIVDPQNVLNAVYDSGGAFVSVTTEEINEMIPRVKSSENLKIAFRGAASLAACTNARRHGLIESSDNAVVILEEGRNELNIRQLTEDDYENIEQLADYVDRYLGQYGDDRQSVLEAIRVALADGFVLGAYISGEMKGIAVVIKMPVGLVMPQYHLVYIGSDITAGSRGIGTRLMEMVRRLTDGRFSLHVDVENKKAIKLYEKMGLKKAYYRMIAMS